MNTSSQTASIARTRDALDLVRSLAIHNPELPAPYITLHVRRSVLLGLQVDHGAFEAWREALAIGTDGVYLMHLGATTHIGIDDVVSQQIGGRRVEVEVHLSGVGLPALPDAAVDPVQLRSHGLPVVTMAEAVALMGALPVPTVGELAEQRHLVDPLDHVLEHLVDERPTVTS